MKRKSKFLIGLLAAVATFGTLSITLGPKHFGSMSACHRYNYQQKSH